MQLDFSLVTNDKAFSLVTSDIGDRGYPMSDKWHENLRGGFMQFFTRLVLW